MSQMRRLPDWFERHDAEIRELAWLGAVAGAPHPITEPTASPTEEPDASALSECTPEVPLMTPEREALTQAEEALALANASIAQLRTELEATHAQAAKLRTELDETEKAMQQFVTKMSEDAETELVKLAITVAERVVARELVLSPNLIIEWAREAIASSDLGGRFIVATSADLSEAIAPAAWGDLEPSLRMDPALPPATCEIRDNGKLITVSSEERLDVIKDSLTLDKPKAA